jgi:hypothetical protein
MNTSPHPMCSLNRCARRHSALQCSQNIREAEGRKLKKQRSAADCRGSILVASTTKTPHLLLIIPNLPSLRSLCNPLRISTTATMSSEPVTSGEAVSTRLHRCHAFAWLLHFVSFRLSIVVRRFVRRFARLELRCCRRPRERTSFYFAALPVSHRIVSLTVSCRLPYTDRVEEVRRVPHQRRPRPR